MSQSKLKFMIVDGNALLHRAWHALPQTMKSPDGKITNAAYGFVMILFRAIRDLRPTHITVCFDVKGPTFRDKIYQDYKAHREKKPQELYDQIPMIQELLDALGIKYYQVKGVEADDVIGTLSKETRNKKQETKTIIVTGDLDALQLVNDSVEVYTMKRGVSDSFVYGVKEVKERYDGLGPDKLIDYKALRGDPSDNIPGAAGIGDKGAIKLIKVFKTVRNLLGQIKSKDLSKLSKKVEVRESILRKVEESFEAVKLSQKLAAIKLDVKLDFDFDKAEFGRFEPERVSEVLQKYGFRSLLTQVKNLADEYDIKGKSQISKIKFKEDYFYIKDDGISDFLINLGKQSEFAFDVETDSLDIVSTMPVGLSFCWEKGQAYYIEYKRLKPKFLSQLREILKNAKIKKIGHNLKFDYQVLQNIGINVNNLYFDTMVAAYIINPGSRQYGLDALAFQHFGHNMQKIEELIGPRGKQGQLNMGQVDPEKVADYAAEDADYTWRLYQKLRPEIKQKDLTKIFYDIEMPQVQILGDMERAGIKLNKKVLSDLSVKVNKRIKQLEAKIYKAAGKEFNIASPLQLSGILFDKLKLETRGIKKIKTGISTAASELEKMRDRHPIINYIFEYRELAKLRSTYIVALPELVNPKTKRIHTSFNQVVTATGRLSSSKPNMQNIPIRTELGREIRRAFVAESGYQLLSLDYSQIDLRMVAHLSGDKKMIKTFQDDEDIHTATAAQIFNVKTTEVTKDQRRKAKEANFGVLYGLGSRGLAQRMQVPLDEAMDFIDRYKALYPKVFEYLDEVILMTRHNGYAETLYGRRRYLPEIGSSAPMIRAAAERMAINMPVQGTAADVLKIAMARIVSSSKYQVSSEIKMLLQVHDELVFEVKKDKVKKWASIIKQEMENAAKLKVPLKVEAKVGKDWRDMEDVNV